MRGSSVAAVIGAVPALVLSIVSGCGGAEWKPVAGPPNASAFPVAPPPEPHDRPHTEGRDRALAKVPPPPAPPASSPEQAAPMASAAASTSASAGKKAPAAPKPPKPKK